MVRMKPLWLDGSHSLHSEVPLLACSCPEERRLNACCRSGAFWSKHVSLWLLSRVTRTSPQCPDQVAARAMLLGNPSFNESDLLRQVFGRGALGQRGSHSQLY